MFEGISLLSRTVGAGNLFEGHLREEWESLERCLRVVSSRKLIRGKMFEGLNPHYQRGSFFPCARAFLRFAVSVHASFIDFMINVLYAYSVFEIPKS